MSLFHSSFVVPLYCSYLIFSFPGIGSPCLFVFVILSLLVFCKQFILFSYHPGNLLPVTFVEPLSVLRFFLLKLYSCLCEWNALHSKAIQNLTGSQECTTQSVPILKSYVHFDLSTVFLSVNSPFQKENLTSSLELTANGVRSFKVKHQ